MIDARANTDEEKHCALEAIYYAWIQVPELRLGQLLHIALLRKDLFGVEDFDLVRLVQNRALELAHYRVHSIVPEPDSPERIQTTPIQTISIPVLPIDPEVESRVEGYLSRNQEKKEKRKLTKPTEPEES